VAAVLPVSPCGHLAVRIARAAGPAGQAERSARDRGSRVLSDDGDPGAAASHHPWPHGGRDVVIVAASGPSGAGRSLKPHLLGAELMGSASAYSVGGVHRHTPELLQNLAACGASEPSVSFTPVLVPMARGILATCTAHSSNVAYLRSGLRGVRRGVRGGAIRPSAARGSVAADQVRLGSNAVQVQVAVDHDAGRLVAVAALDNLTKGTAGAAVQCMNLALGLPETTGLTTIGVAP
jgi:N-acetyl-gamma-glutamyl-phosphate reductase